MKIIIGLGNIGREYENTRHNAGFMAMDKLAQMLEMDFNQEKFSAYFSKKKIDGEDIILLKPTTYMNNSGIALRQCMDFYKVPSEDILVLYDDMDMPVGKLRLRQKGSAGGHNGIKSIISHIGTQEFDRIRIGIGKDKMIAATFLGRTQVEYHFDAIQDYIPGAYSMSEAEMTFHDGAVKRSREILGDDAEAVREGLAAKIVMRLTSKP